MPLGQGGHDLGVAYDKGGGDAERFDEFANEFVEEASGGSGFGTVDVMLW